MVLPAVCDGTTIHVQALLGVCNWISLCVGLLYLGYVVDGLADQDPIFRVGSLLLGPGKTPLYRGSHNLTAQHSNFWKSHPPAKPQITWQQLLTPFSPAPSCSSSLQGSTHTTAVLRQANLLTESSSCHVIMCDHMSVFLLVESCSQPAGPSPQVHQPGVGLQGQQLAHLAHHLHREDRRRCGWGWYLWVCVRWVLRLLGGQLGVVAVGGGSLGHCHWHPGRGWDLESWPKMVLPGVKKKFIRKWGCIRKWRPPVLMFTQVFRAELVYFLIILID